MTSSRDDGSWREVGAPAGEAPAAAARLGADLRAARERLGWTLPAMAAHLRIRLPFLEAIEQGRVHDLPGNTYALGFVRTYARALGLDVAEVARRFRLEAGEVNRRTELDFPAPAPERGIPVLAGVLVSAVLIVGAYAAWYRMGGNARPTAEMVQQVPERLMPLVADKPAGVATPNIASAPLARGAPPVAPQLAEATPAPPPAPAAAPRSVSPSSAAAATTQLPQTLASADAARPPGAPHMVLRATADAWMQVRDKSGQVLLNRVLRAGETWQVPDGQSSLLLSTGNAGGTVVVVDGVASAPLGGDGAVRRDLPLDANAIKGGKLAANAAAAAARRVILPHNQ